MRPPTASCKSASCPPLKSNPPDPSTWNQSLRAAKVAYQHAGAEVSSSHRRRTSRTSHGAHVPPDASILASKHHLNTFASTTPFHEEDEAAYAESPQQMSLDRSPSPQRGGGWSSPGLTTPVDELGAAGASRSRGASPRKGYGELNGGRGVTWATAKAGSARVNGYPSYQSQNQGFFGRHMRRISSGLPQYLAGGGDDRYAEKEKLGRGRSKGWMSGLQELPRRLGLLLSRRRKHAALLVMAVLAVMVWFSQREDIIQTYGKSQG